MSDPVVGQGIARGGTYLLRDAETGQVMRTGRTQNLERRKDEHKRDAETKDLDFEIDRYSDKYDEQRGREQILHERYNPPLNKINPIRPNHPNRQRYLKAAKNLE